MERNNRTESWRAVPNWLNYEVSDMGRVRSIGHWVTRRPGSRPSWYAGKLLDPGGDRYGHVRLQRPGEHAYLSVHVLVLEAFSGPRPPGQWARHGPLGPSVNWWPENLSWGTPAENNGLDKVRDGTLLRGEQLPKARLTALIVVECRQRRAEGETAAALAIEFDVSVSTMYRALSGKSWPHVPFPQ